MIPNRRMISGWFETSCGRNTICSLYLAKSSPNDSTRFFDNENAVADANLTTPASIKSKIPSCRTSEYTSISLNCESFIPLNTAFATEPTPGEVEAGRLPKSLAPLQSGVGSVANAVLSGMKDSQFKDIEVYSEVLQDGIFDLIDAGVVKFASATAFSLSKKRVESLGEDLAKYKE